MPPSRRRPHFCCFPKEAGSGGGSNWFLQHRMSIQLCSALAHRARAMAAAAIREAAAELSYAASWSRVSKVEAGGGEQLGGRPAGFGGV